MDCLVFGKSVVSVWMRATPPGHNAGADPDDTGVSIAPGKWRKQILNSDPKHIAEEFNLCVGNGRTACFDVGQNIACHVAPTELKFRDQIVLLPVVLVAQLGDSLSDDIGVVVHMHLRLSKA
jgi:hypothetical protein